METDAILSIEDTNLIIETVAAWITRPLVSHDSRTDQAFVRHFTNVALGRNDVEALTMRLADRFKAAIAGRVGSNVARLSRDALASPDGLRRWLGDAHKAALIAFHQTASEYRAGEATPLDLFLAQIALAGIAEARGLLGIPVEAKDRPTPRNVRSFEPEDYPDRKVRAAIVKAAFNGDSTSVALLHKYVATPEHDAKGQVTLVLACLASSDGDMRSQLAALAGKIILKDRMPIEVKKSKGEIWARMLRTPFDQQLAASERPSSNH